MYKFLVTLPLFFAAVSAGFIGAPYAHGGLAYGHAVSAPVAIATPVHVHAAPVAVAAHAPVATSYANTYRVVHSSVPVVKTVAHAAPAVAIHAAPAVAVHVAHAPLVAHGYHH